MWLRFGPLDVTAAAVGLRGVFFAIPQRGHGERWAGWVLVSNILEISWPVVTPQPDF